MLISYIESAQHTHPATLVSVGECAERGLICSGIIYFPATHTVKCGGLCAWCRYKIVAPTSFIDRHKTIQLSTLDEGRQLFCVICQKFPTVAPTSICCGACALLHAFECDYIVFCGWVLRDMLGADVGRIIAAEMLYFFYRRSSQIKLNSVSAPCMSIIPHLSSLAALEKWIAQSTDLEIFDVCHNEFYSFAGICKSRLWAARVRFYLNGPADKITTGYNQFDLLQDIRPLRYLPVHWDVHSHGVVTCGLCLEEVNDSCKACRDRREIIAELAARAQQLIIHKPILADIVGHIVGWLALMSAGLLIQMPTLAFGMGSQ